MCLIPAGCFRVKELLKSLIKSLVGFRRRTGIQKTEEGNEMTGRVSQHPVLKGTRNCFPWKESLKLFFNGKWNKISCRCAGLIKIYQQNTRYIILILYVNMLYFTQNANFWNKQLFQRMKTKFLLQTLYIDPFDIKTLSKLFLCKRTHPNFSRRCGFS